MPSSQSSLHRLLTRAFLESLAGMRVLGRKHLFYFTDAFKPRGMIYRRNICSNIWIEEDRYMDKYMNVHRVMHFLHQYSLSRAV